MHHTTQRRYPGQLPSTRQTQGASFGNPRSGTRSDAYDSSTEEYDLRKHVNTARGHFRGMKNNVGGFVTDKHTSLKEHLDRRQQINQLGKKYFAQMEVSQHLAYDLRTTFRPEKRIELAKLILENTEKELEMMKKVVEEESKITPPAQVEEGEEAPDRYSKAMKKAERLWARSLNQEDDAMSISSEEDSVTDSDQELPPVTPSTPEQLALYLVSWFLAIHFG
ncbi:hypothetical protein T439DRAFT_356378 [Meredithblackwellia eburnea MCA 4105]